MRTHRHRPANATTRTVPDGQAAGSDSGNQPDHDVAEAAPRRRQALTNAQGTIAARTRACASAHTLRAASSAHIAERSSSATTVIGSYPVPEWLRALPNSVNLRDAVMVVMKSQELAGIDVGRRA